MSLYIMTFTSFTSDVYLYGVRIYSEELSSLQQR